MKITRLLAKSSRTPESPRQLETLCGHLASVTQVAVLLAEEWGEHYLTSLGLAPSTFGPWLRLALPRAALAHDWGKANDHFQRMLRSDKTIAVQAGWHEQLSVWMALDFCALSDWLFQGCNATVRQAILIAILGHHLRVEDGTTIGLRDQSGALRLEILSGHEDFGSTLQTGAKLLDLTNPPGLPDVVIDLIAPASFDDVMHRWALEAAAWWRAATPEERRFAAAVKALLIAADGAGSAVPRMLADPVAWTKATLSRVCIADDLSQVVTKRLNGLSPRPFQRAVETSASRVTFVRAGCGSGKTVAAYLWAAKHGTGRKLFFCYPTTGTASQGFADYVPPDQFEAALIHSRATADLEDLLSNGKADAEDRLSWLTRYAALAAWDAPITVCTVDTVLGLIQNNRTGLFSFPSIANGAVIFDEIHQYDDRLFGALLRFLATMQGAPMLLMTASLPQARLIAIRDTLDRQGERLEIIEGPADFEAIKRYQVERVEADTAWRQVVAAVRDRRRVLWVVNTVDRAVELARKAVKLGLPVLPYHSRYRYHDRLKRHAEVIRAFTHAAKGSALAVTTQVCEVSLDLSADLLVTDLAPIPALIQRLGRLNRRVTPNSPVRVASALVLEPELPNPYESAELAEARRWLDLLGDEPLSQADLAEAVDRVVADTPARSPQVESAWLDGGVLARRAALREEGATIPVIRKEDAACLESLPLEKKQREIIRLTIPMPLGPVARAIGAWPRIGGTLIAPAGQMEYDERFGGHWR